MYVHKRGGNGVNLLECLMNCMDKQVEFAGICCGLKNQQIEYYMETRINTRFFEKVILNL